MEKIKSSTSTTIVHLIRGYQYWISPLLGNRCRFFPSCSHYAETAIRYHGLWLGSWLACKRLLRCQPFHPGGYDPIKTQK